MTPNPASVGDQSPTRGASLVSPLDAFALSPRQPAFGHKRPAFLIRQIDPRRLG
jgi:hypothetical protein